MVELVYTISKSEKNEVKFMKVEIRKPVYFVPGACSKSELFISRNDFADSYTREHDFFYEEFISVLEMYCAQYGCEVEMNEETAEQIYKTIAANKKTIEGIYTGVCMEDGKKTLYLAYAAYGAPGKRIHAVTIKEPETDSQFEIK